MKLLFAKKKAKHEQCEKLAMSFTVDNFALKPFLPSHYSQFCSIVATSNYLENKYSCKMSALCIAYFSLMEQIIKVVVGVTLLVLQIKAKEDKDFPKLGKDKKI